MIVAQHISVVYYHLIQNTMFRNYLRLRICSGNEPVSLEMLL